MARATKIFVSICILLLSFVIATYGLDSSDLPPVACPEIFRYQQVQGKVTGIFTLTDIPFGTFNVEVTFSQKEQITTRFRGRLSFEHDLITVQKNFEDGSPIILKMIFPLSTEVPKLIRITMNDEVICSADTPVDHEVIYSLRRSFTPTEGTHRKLKNTTPPETTNTEKASGESLDSLVCGLSSFNPINLTIGQYDVKWGWFPWAVRIYRSNNFAIVGSGILISTRTVITTARFYNSNDTAENIIAHLGAFGLSDFDESYPVTRRIKTLLVHPEYNTKTYSDADIALLQLALPVTFNRYILPICLWSEDEGGINKVGETAFAAFIGIDGFDRVMNASIISQSQCLKSSRGYIQTISSRTFCADYHHALGPRHVFHRGSGMIINRNGRWMFLGMYSACLVLNEKCNPDLYFVYTDVTKYNTWIRENM